MSMTTDQERSSNPERMLGGWLEHKSAEKNKWGPVWCVLKRDGTLFFFSSQETSLETHIGTLHMTKETTFHSGPGDAREGFRFDLIIQKKRKKFRVKKQYDRELWRVYLVAVITGRVPEDANISPQDLQTVSTKIQLGHQTPTSTSTPYPAPSTPTAAPPPTVSPTSPTSRAFPSSSSSSPSLPSSTSFSSLSSHQRFAAPSQGRVDDGTASCHSWEKGRERRDSLPSMTSSGTGSSNDGGFEPPDPTSEVNFSLLSDRTSLDSGVSGNTGGPFMIHKFDEKDNRTPSWFFEDCSRQLAEKILRECRHKGNTLMRISGSARPNGSYVISKNLESEQALVHYEVIRVATGYKINAENVPKTMRTLQEVMDFFVQLSGAQTTHPMVSNNLEELGVEYDAYNRGPIIMAKSASTDVFQRDAYEVPQQQSPRSRPGEGVLPSAPPAPPPAPPLPSPTSPFSLGKGANFSYTWGKDRTGPLKWQTPDNFAGPAAKTVGPAEKWRGVKLPDSSNGKTSAMQVNQNIREHQAVANLDDVIRVEEERVHLRVRQDGRPPLPEVPADRPRLCSVSTDNYYVNATSGKDDVVTDEEGAAASQQRWNKRSQSLTALQAQDTNVPANVPPPSVVKPGAAGVGGVVGAGAGVKVAPKTGTNPPLPRPQSKGHPLLNNHGAGKGHRRPSLPLLRLRRLQERWSWRRRDVPLPLPPDYSSSSDNDDGDDDDNDDNDDDETAITPPARGSSLEPRKMSLNELSLSRKQLDIFRSEKGVSGPVMVEKDSTSGIGDVATLNSYKSSPEADESLSYCQVVVEPQIRPRNASGAHRRPESMVYSEIMIQPSATPPSGEDSATMSHTHSPGDVEQAEKIFRESSTTAKQPDSELKANLNSPNQISTSTTKPRKEVSISENEFIPKGLTAKSKQYTKGFKGKPESPLKEILKTDSQGIREGSRTNMSTHVRATTSNLPLGTMSSEKLPRTVIELENIYEETGPAAYEEFEDVAIERVEERERLALDSTKVDNNSSVKANAKNFNEGSKVKTGNAPGRVRVDSAGQEKDVPVSKTIHSDPARLESEGKPATPVSILKDSTSNSEKGGNLVSKAGNSFEETGPTEGYEEFEGDVEIRGGSDDVSCDVGGDVNSSSQIRSGFEKTEPTAEYEELEGTVEGRGDSDDAVDDVHTYFGGDVSAGVNAYIDGHDVSAGDGRDAIAAVSPDASAEVDRDVKPDAGGDVSGSEVSGGDVYYLQLLEEGEEVVYDLMYSTGRGSILFWRPQGSEFNPDDAPSPSSLFSSTDIDVPNIMPELQRKLDKMRLRSEGQEQPTTTTTATTPTTSTPSSTTTGLRRQNERALPPTPVPQSQSPGRGGGGGGGGGGGSGDYDDEDGEMYEDISQYYQNVGAQ